MVNESHSQGIARREPETATSRVHDRALRGPRPSSCRFTVQDARSGTNGFAMADADHKEPVEQGCAGRANVGGESDHFARPKL